jgi:hypothetical protein
MARMLDCLVSFFGLDENDRPTYRRYFCYHIFAGPGPTTGAGIAAITTLAVHDEDERCSSCRHFFAVPTGGPATALATAAHYLDAYHQRDHLWKVQSDIRGLDEDQSTETALSPEVPFRASRVWSVTVPNQ